MSSVADLGWLVAAVVLTWIVMFVMTDGDECGL